MTERQFRPPASDWVGKQLETIDATGDTRSVQVQNRPVVVFTVRGATSGLYRRVPVMRVEHDGVYAVVASAGGQPKHPAWYHNLVANPEIELQDGTELRRMRARQIFGDEREQWWGRCVAAFPPYAEYQKKTERQIPVLLSEQS
ncbi:MAG: nitroreductase family deazaflavin-dependent oxidoreductase [Propionibacteriaceae bacterium]